MLFFEKDPACRALVAARMGLPVDDVGEIGINIPKSFISVHPEHVGKTLRAIIRDVSTPDRRWWKYREKDIRLILVDSNGEQIVEYHLIRLVSRTDNKLALLGTWLRIHHEQVFGEGSTGGGTAGDGAAGTTNSDSRPRKKDDKLLAMQVAAGDGNARIEDEYRDLQAGHVALQEEYQELAEEHEELQTQHALLNSNYADLLSKCRVLEHLNRIEREKYEATKKREAELQAMIDQIRAVVVPEQVEQVEAEMPKKA